MGGCGIVEREKYFHEPKEAHISIFFKKKKEERGISTTQVNRTEQFEEQTILRPDLTFARKEGNRLYIKTKEALYQNKKKARKTVHQLQKNTWV